MNSEYIPVIAFFASLALLCLTQYLKLGPTDDWVNRVRRRLHPVIRRVAQELGSGFYGTVVIDDHERACVIEKPVDEVERQLEYLGFRRNIAASVKKDSNGTLEASSWAYRQSRFGFIPNALAIRQVHVILFAKHEHSKNITKVYTHEEYNAINPLVAYLHYRGVTKNPEKGKKEFLKLWISQYGRAYIR